MQDDDAPIEGTAEEIPAEQDHEQPQAVPTGSELVHRPVGSTELIHAASAADRVKQATEIATALDSVVRAQGMRTKVGSQKKLDPATGEPVRDSNGREVWVPRWHVNVEGWQTLATLLGLAVVPLPPYKVIDPTTALPERVQFTVKERQTKGQGQNRTVTEREYEVVGYSWGCRVEIFKDGTLIGAGESICSRTEQRWKEADDYAVMGMAQTRATSRAIGAAARWIVTLAGYSATPAEEMPPEMVDGQQPQSRPRYGPALDPAKRAIVFEAIKALLELDQEPAAAAGLADLHEVAKAVAGAISSGPGYMPQVTADALLALANAREARKTAALEAMAKETEAADAMRAAAGQGPVEESAPVAGAKDAAEAWPTGKVWIRGEQNIPDGAHEVSLSAAVRICNCPGGFDAAEKGGPKDDACPLRNHGIPF